MLPSRAKNSAVPAKAASKRGSPVPGGFSLMSEIFPGLDDPLKSSAKPNSRRSASYSRACSRSSAIIGARCSSDAAPRRVRGDGEVVLTCVEQSLQGGEGRRSHARLVGRYRRLGRTGAVGRLKLCDAGVTAGLPDQVGNLHEIQYTHLDIFY